MNFQQKKELIRFIDFHSKARSSTQNSVQAIVSQENLTSDVVGIFNFLNKESTVLHYSKSTDVERFIEDLVWALYEGKAVLIVTDTLDFDPILYDQLIQIREQNKFTVNFKKDELNRATISPVASIFLTFRDNGENNKLEELVDHVIKVQDIN